MAVDLQPAAPLQPGAAGPGVAESRLTIRSLRLDCQVPATVSDPGAAQRRLERTARDRLPAALAQALAPLDRAGDGVLLLRRLELDLVLDPTLDPDALARHWAAALRHALARMLDDRGDADRGADGLVHFADRRHWLARFVVDLAAGRAWQGWLHRPFDGLAALPLSAALRTALADPAEDGAGALLLLDEAEAVRVIGTLTAGDARRLLAVLAAPAGEDIAVETALPGLLKALTAGAPARQLAASQPSRGALALWLAGLRATPGAGRQPLAALAVALAELIRIGSRDAGRARALAAWLRDADLAGTATGAETADGIAPALRPLATLERSAREALLAAVDPSPSTRLRPAPIAAEPRWTRFGNAFLLLPAIAQLPLATLIEPWPRPADEDGAALLRWALLAAAQGRQERAACLRDPLVADLCGIGPRTTVLDLERWLGDIDAPIVELARERLLDWLAAESGRLESVDLDAADPGLRSAPRHNRRPDAAHMERVVLETRRGCWLRLLGTADPSPTTPPEMDSAGPERAAAVAADLTFLVGGHDGDANKATAAELLVAQLAQVVLKRLAFRLPGFADSSLRYLHRNFLGMDARLTAHEDHLDAVLGQVPLQLVLSMTGADRRTLSLPWFSSLPVRVRRESSR